MSTGDREVDDFIGSHSDAELLPTGKVRCTLTSHEMPAKVNLLRGEHWSRQRSIKTARSAPRTTSSSTNHG